MSKNVKDVENSQEELTRFGKIKKYGKKNWKPLVIGAGIAVVTIGAIIVTKRVFFPRYLYTCSGGTNLLMNRVLFKKSALYHITNIHGAPVNRLSIIVKCVETGETRNSLAAMAREMDVSPSHISRHINFPEMYPGVKGYHFEKVGMADYNHGNWKLSA